MVTPRGISDGEAKVKVAHQIAGRRAGAVPFGSVVCHAHDLAVFPSGGTHVRQHKEAVQISSLKGDQI
jgi:hypothetical protein